MLNKIFVISGGPGTGKTAVINELKKQGYKTIPEVARQIATRDRRFKGKSIKQINQKIFQEVIFNYQSKQLEKLEKSKFKTPVFSDRGIGDTLAYNKFYHINISKQKINLVKKFRYSKIFILDFLEFYEKDKLRKENKKEQEKIHRLIINSYKNLGYKIVFVPFMGIEERVEFILSKIN